MPTPAAASGKLWTALHSLCHSYRCKTAFIKLTPRNLLHFDRIRQTPSTNSNHVTGYPADLVAGMEHGNVCAHRSALIFLWWCVTTVLSFILWIQVEKKFWSRIAWRENRSWQENYAVVIVVWCDWRLQKKKKKIQNSRGYNGIYVLVAVLHSVVSRNTWERRKAPKFVDVHALSMATRRKKRAPRIYELQACQPPSVVSLVPGPGDSDGLAGGGTAVCACVAPRAHPTYTPDLNRLIELRRKQHIYAKIKTDRGGCS